MSYDKLRQAVQGPWDAMEQQKLEELISSMKDRCQAVIDANGSSIYCRWRNDLVDGESSSECSVLTMVMHAKAAARGSVEHVPLCVLPLGFLLCLHTLAPVLLLL